MADTTLKLKNGEELNAPLYLVELKHSRIKLSKDLTSGGKSSLPWIYIDDIETAITEGQDQLAIWRIQMSRARKHGWWGLDENTPICDWER